MLAGSGALALAGLSMGTVSRAGTATRLLPGGFSSARLQALTNAMQGYIDRDEAAGMVSTIFRHGVPAYTGVIGWQNKERKIRMGADSIFRLASMSKPLVAAATLTLMDDGTLSLNDPVEKFLPELAGRQVLRDPGGPLDHTVPASRPMRIVDLLTHRSGLVPGAAVALTAPDIPRSPLTQAMVEADRARLIGGDAWLREVSKLPLAYDPGSKFYYGISFDLLGVLLARAAGKSLPDLLRDRLLEPLGMRDTGFQVPAEKRGRLASVYQADVSTNKIAPQEETLLSQFSPPTFPSGEGGLYSTAKDYLQAARMLLGRGRLNDVRVLSHRAVALMTSNYLTPQQRQESVEGIREWAGHGFGLGVWVVDDVAEQDAATGYFDGYASAGSYGWPGYFGCWWQVDPKEDMIQLLMIQLLPPQRHEAIRKKFESMAYLAIDD